MSGQPTGGRPATGRDAAPATRGWLRALPGRLRWKAMTSRAALHFMATRVLPSRDLKVRRRFFRMLGEAPGADYAYVHLGRERYLVNTRDQAISRTVFVEGGFEFDKVETALRLLRAHTPITGLDLLVDVGANIGTVCIPAVARGLAGAAVAIEPHPVNCMLLRANVALNGVGARVAVHECAVGAADGETLAMEISEDNWGDHRVAVTSAAGSFGESARHRITIPSMRLDSLVPPRAGQRLLVWMDTQGYEGFVLRGAGALLAERVPVVTEFWPYGMRRAGSYPLLREHLAGYRGFIDLQEAGAASLGGDALRPMRELDALHDRLLADDTAYTDLLVV